MRACTHARVARRRDVGRVTSPCIGGGRGGGCAAAAVPARRGGGGAVTALS